MVEITASYPAGPFEGSTAQHLADAAAGEHEEWVDLYPAFAEVAQAEGFKDVATTFRMVAKAEAMHEARYLKLRGQCGGERGLREAGEGPLDVPQVRLHSRGSPRRSKVCPTCTHPQAYQNTRRLCESTDVAWPTARRLAGPPGTRRGGRPEGPPAPSP